MISASRSNHRRRRTAAAADSGTGSLAGRTAYPSLDVLVQVLRVPELGTAFRAAVIEPRLSLVHSILLQGASTGEIPGESATPLIARTGPALVIQTFLLTGEPPTGAEIIDIVDKILIPLAQPAAKISLAELDETSESDLCGQREPVTTCVRRPTPVITPPTRGDDDGGAKLRAGPAG
jgi:hypothetical protein